MWVSWFTSTRCHWLQVTSLWLLWRKAAPKPGVNCFQGRQTWKLQKFFIKVFCSAGLSASWVSYGVGRHFFQNFIAQIDTSEENHRGMEKISSLWRLQSFLWIKHAALADLAPFGKEHVRMLASQNSPASSAKQLKKITKWSSLKDMADTCTFTPGFPHQLSQLYHPFFMILFLHARIGMLQLRLEQIQHGAGRLGPWKNKGCLTVYPTVITKLQQWQWLRWMHWFSIIMTVGHGSWTTSGKPVMESGSSVGTL